MMKLVTQNQNNQHKHNKIVKLVIHNNITNNKITNNNIINNNKDIHKIIRIY